MNDWQAFYIGLALATLIVTRVVVRTMHWRRMQESKDAL